MWRLSTAVAAVAVLLAMFPSESQAFLVPSKTPTTTTTTMTRWWLLPTTTTTQLHMQNKRSKKNTLKSKPKAGGGFAGALRELQVASFPYAGSIRPGNQSPQKLVTEPGIVLPDYANDGMVCTKNTRTHTVLSCLYPCMLVSSMCVVELSCFCC